jgi:hypothetical protein
MSYRRNTAKPSVALWMLVALGDVLLFLASGGLLALITLISVVTVAVAAVGVWLMRRGTADRDAVPARVPVSGTHRRRA